LAGPAIQLAGITWQGIHVVLYHWGGGFTPRHLFFEPGVLMVLVGLAVAVVCVPVALEVATARPAELAQPEPDEELRQLDLRPERHIGAQGAK
jgi:hypothetical protein